MPSDRGRAGRQPPAPPGAGGDFFLQAHDWAILFHPLLLDQLQRLVSAAEKERAAREPGDPEGANTKLASAIRRIVFQEVPEDPSRPKYRHGGTLGEDLKHWLRAKFGGGRFRLFFRYRKDVRVIVLAWVNDSDSLRTYGGHTDAYAVFRPMLGTGSPPDDWNALVRAASAPEAQRRARQLFGMPDL